MSRNQISYVIHMVAQGEFSCSFVYDTAQEAACALARLRHNRPDTTLHIGERTKTTVDCALSENGLNLRAAQEAQKAE